MLAVLLVAAAGWLSPCYAPWDASNMANDDWLMHYAFHGFLRRSVLEYGEYPVWCRFFGGGYPIVGHPEFPSFTPLAANTLLFGERVGLKVNALLVFLAGTAGAWLAARQVLGLSRPAAAAATLALACSSWFPARLFSGNANETYFWLFPLQVWLMERAAARRSAASLAACAALFALVAFDGKTVLVATGFMLCLYAALRALTAERDGAPRIALPLSAVLALALAAWAASGKLLLIRDLVRPASGERIEIYHHGDRYGPDNVEAYDPAGLWQSLTTNVVLGSNQAASSLFLGWPALALAAAGMAGCAAAWLKALRRRGGARSGAYLRGLAPWAVLAVTAAWLGAAHRWGPFDLFGALQWVPGFQLIRTPGKYFDYFVALALALAAGTGVEMILHVAAGPLSARGWRTAAVAALAGAAGLAAWVLVAGSAPERIQELGAAAYALHPAPYAFFWGVVLFAAGASAALLAAASGGRVRSAWACAGAAVAALAAGAGMAAAWPRTHAGAWEAAAAVRYGGLMAAGALALGAVLAVRAPQAVLRPAMLAAALAALGLAQPVCWNERVVRHIFPTTDRDIAGLRIVPAERFVQVKTTWQDRRRQTPLSSPYYNLLANRGVINWYTSILLPEYAVPHHFVEPGGGTRANPWYRGEAYLLEADKPASAVEFGVNRIVCRVECATDDRLVVNQNHHPWWRSSAGPVEPHKGLISVAVAAGTREVVFECRPALVRWAAAASGSGVLALAALAVFGARLVRGRARPQPGT